MSVLIYTRAYCGYCVRAKRLLNAKGIKFKEISVDGSDKLLTKMKAKSGQRTVPQIWINDQHIGGCTELYAVEQQGKLDAMLGQCRS